MDDTKKRIVLLSTCGLAILAFVYFANIHKDNSEKDTDRFVNPALLDDSPSKMDAYAEKRKREHQDYNFERKVNSLENFLDNPVIKDPFSDSSAQAKVDSLKIPSGEKPEANEKIVYVSKLPEKMQETDQSQLTKETGNDNENQDSREPRRKAGFASGGSDHKTESEAKPGTTDIRVLAVVQENAGIKSGSDIKLRILEPFATGGITIPENTFAVGRVLLSDDHIYIDVNSISVNGRLLAVDLTVYDLNGSRGIYVEGGLDKEIKSDVLDETISEIQRNVNIPILRNLPFSVAKKKIQEPEILVTAGLKVYLSNR